MVQRPGVFGSWLSPSSR